MYHINPSTGNVSLCKASSKPCPFISQDDTLKTHYSTKSEAFEAYENFTKSNKKNFRKKIQKYEGYDETLETLKNIFENISLNDDECLLVTGQSKKVRKILEIDGSVVGSNENIEYGDAFIEDSYNKVKEVSNSEGLIFTFRASSDTIEDLYEDYEDIYFDPDEKDLYILKVKKANVIHTSYHHEWSNAISGYDSDYTLENITPTNIDSEFGGGNDLQVIIQDMNIKDILKVISSD